MDHRFELLAEALPQIVWICSADGQNVFFNQKWVDYTGLSLEESHGAGWNKPFHPEDQQRAWKAWDNAVHLKGTYSLECRLRRKDGEYRWWLVRGVPSLADDGSIKSWFGTCTDIHDMRVAADETEQRAEAAEVALQLAIEGADLGVWQWHIKEDRLIWSDRAKALFGLPLDTEMSYARWVACLHPDDRSRAEADSTHASAQGGLFDVDYRVVWPDGTIRWINAVARARYDAAGQPLRMDGVVRDISQQKSDQARLHDANAMLSNALEDAQGANRAKAAFLATTSHELRTPLNAVIGFSTLLLAGQMGPVLDSQRRPLEIVKHSGEQLLALVQDILDVTAIEAGSLRMNVNPTPLKQLLVDVRDQLAPRAAERGIALPEIDGDAELQVLADSDRLCQAVRNLVSNGLSYTDRGYVKISAAVQGDFACIDVTDSGIGIPAAESHKVFQAFQPIQRIQSQTRGGTGLGLAITRRIVETMGGEVGYTSELGVGSRFWIKIPLAHERSGPARADSSNC